ncbi:MAG TPA: bifunctional DNA primase/polymerase [Candidatus Binatia bacterium]|jgi:hypothetical protein
MTASFEIEDHLDECRNDEGDGDGGDGVFANLWEAAQRYRELGYRTFPVPRRSKGAVESWKKYQTEDPDSETFEGWFKDTTTNIGLLTGEASGGVVDVDLDCLEAVYLAPHFLPETGMIHGREGNPESHHYFKVSSVPSYKAYKDEDGKMLMERRGDKHYTIVPPSIHEDTGEQITWVSDSAVTSVTTVTTQELEEATNNLAACTILSRAWPAKGSRHDFALAVAGSLLRAGKDEEFIKKMIRLAAETADDEEVEDRIRAVETTAQSLKTNSPTTGYTTLVSLMGQKRAEKFADWLGMETTSNKTSSKRETAANQAEDLLRLVEDKGVELFHNQQHVPYASYQSAKGWETSRISDASFSRWLGHVFYNSTNTIPNTDAVKKAIATLEGMSLYEGETKKVFIRVGEHDGKVYLDLADETGRVVEVDAAGWTVLDTAPIKFERPLGMLPLPEPERGGSVELLGECLNIWDEVSFKLTVGWLLGALSPTGPYPIAVFRGEHGSGKSCNTKFTRRLIDPCSPDLVPAPKNEHNLMIQARNSHVLCFDNLSRITPEVSDFLCRLSTGGGYRSRTLYKDDQESLIDATRPQILNGIDDIARRGDLVDRCIVFDLPRIEERKTEKELEATFQAIHGPVLGALLDAVSGILACEDDPVIPDIPRMADFVTWVSKAEETLGWEPGSFVEAYRANSSAANDAVIEDSNVAAAVLWFMQLRKRSWTGTCSELLDIFKKHRDQIGASSGWWPDTPSILYSELRRLAPNLLEAGISIEKAGRSKKGRKLVIDLVKNGETEKGNNIQQAA